MNFGGGNVVECGCCCAFFDQLPPPKTGGTHCFMVFLGFLGKKWGEMPPLGPFSAQNQVGRCDFGWWWWWCCTNVVGASKNPFAPTCVPFAICHFSTFSADFSKMDNTSTSQPFFAPKSCVFGDFDKKQHVYGWGSTLCWTMFGVTLSKIRLGDVILGGGGGGGGGER